MYQSLADLDTDIEERKGESGDSQKYEMLFQRDQEMTSFIDSFEKRKQDEMSEQSKTQETIVALLEHISRGLQREGSMPSKNKLKEMQVDLSFKEKQATNRIRGPTKLHNVSTVYFLLQAKYF